MQPPTINAWWRKKVERVWLAEENSLARREEIFSVTVGAKLAGHRRAMMLAVSTDAVPIAPTMSFELDGKPLPPGLYLLFVVIRIGSTTAFGAEAGTLSVLEKAVS